MVICEQEGIRRTSESTWGNRKKAMQETSTPPLE